MEQKVRLSTVCLGDQGDLIKPDQIHVVNILPGFQTGVEELLTKTWIESWTTTSPQPRPAPRTPESAPSSATWICTVAASQDLCMGEDPSAQDGAGRVDQNTQTSEAPYPIHCPQLWLRAAHVQGLCGISRWLPAAAVSAGHWHRCLPATPPH